MTRGSSTIEIDETTGQVRRFELRDEEAGTEFILGAAPDRLAKEISTLDRRLASTTNAWRFDAPLTSLAQFSLDEYAHVANVIGRPLPATKLALVQQLVPRVCRRADQWLATILSDSKPESFSFPPPEHENKGWQHFAAGWLLKGAEIGFPHDSPPWTLSRETAFLLAGKGMYAQRELNGLLNSPTTGPLSGLYAAGLFKFINADVSRRFARTSLARTDVRFLRRDLQWLLSPDCLARTPLLDTADALRELKPEEIRALAGLITEDEPQRESISAALSLPRSQRDHPLAEVLPTTLEALWDAWLKQRVERWLQQLSEQGLPKDAVGAVNANQGTSRIPTTAGG
jgi:hypothetical protein